jgi:hypothetical protein
LHFVRAELSDYYGHPRSRQKHENQFFADMDSFIAAMSIISVATKRAARRKWVRAKSLNEAEVMAAVSLEMVI